MNNKNELLKSSGSIFITGNPSLLQRKSYNALYLRARENLLMQEIHSINLSELADLAGFDSNNIATFKAVLGGLLTCTVEWDILNRKGNQEWSKSTLLSGIKIENGVVEYAYSPFLREKLANDDYAKLDLLIQNRFESKYSLALWELCCNRYKVGSTGEYDVEKVRRFLGAESGYYKNFGVFNAKVLKPAIKDVNQKSEFLIAIELIKSGKTVVKIRFLIKEKKDIQEAHKTPQDERKPVLATPQYPTQQEPQIDPELTKQKQMEFFQKYKTIDPKPTPVIPTNFQEELEKTKKEQNGSTAQNP